MRKLITILLFLALLVPAVPAAAAGRTYGVSVFVDAKPVAFPDQRPFIDENGRTLVPLRFVAQEMGAEAKWLEADRTVLIEKTRNQPSLIDRIRDVRSFQDLLREAQNLVDRILISLRIGENRARVNDREVTFDTRPVVVNNRTMVPLRFISETLGADVQWRADTRTALIWTLPEAQRPAVDPGVQVINGFVVPNQTDLRISGPFAPNNVEISFGIGVHRPMQPQLAQAKAALESKFGPDRAIDQAIAYAGQKTDRVQVLESRIFNVNGHRIQVGSDAGNFLTSIIVRRAGWVRP